MILQDAMKFGTGCRKPLKLRFIEWQEKNKSVLGEKLRDRKGRGSVGGTVSREVGDHWPNQRNQGGRERWGKELWQLPWDVYLRINTCGLT